MSPEPARGLEMVSFTQHTWLFSVAPPLQQGPQLFWKSITATTKATESCLSVGCWEPLCVLQALCRWVGGMVRVVFSNRSHCISTAMYQSWLPAKTPRQALLSTAGAEQDVLPACSQPSRSQAGFWLPTGRN